MKKLFIILVFISTLLLYIQYVSTQTNLVAYWKFDEGIGSTAFDSSGNGNDGTLENIYPLDVIANNPSLEEPWYLVNDQDVNHRIERPEDWTVSYNYDTSSKMLALNETSIVKYGNSSIRMELTTGAVFNGYLSIHDSSDRFPIDENMYLEGGNFQYPIKGPSSYGDQSLYFYNSTGHFMCRRWAGATNLEVDMGDGWRMRSHVWQPSSLDPNPPSACDGDDPAANIPYIPQGSTQAYFQQYYSWHTANVDRETVFDKFFIYQWSIMPTNEQRINRASSGWIDGKYGNALNFDGINDYVDVGTLNVVGGGLTILAWFMADDFDVNDGRIISKATTQAEQDHYWMLSTINSGGMKLRFRLKTGSDPSTGTTTLIASSGDLSAGEWIHAAAVYNGSHMLLYKNATLVGSISKTGTIATNNIVSVWMGDNPGPNRKQFDGIIDEVKIYNRSLTADEIYNEYTTGSPTTTTTTTSTTSTTSTTLASANYDFKIWSEGPQLFTIGKKEIVNVYIQNTGNRDDSYTVSFTKEALFEGGDVKHLIDVSIPSNKINLVNPNRTGNIFATITLLGPITSGSVTFNATSESDSLVKRIAEPIEIKTGYPISLPEFGLMGLMLLILISSLIISYSSHFR